MRNSAYKKKWVVSASMKTVQFSSIPEEASCISSIAPLGNGDLGCCQMFHVSTK